VATSTTQTIICQHLPLIAAVALMIQQMSFKPVLSVSLRPITTLVSHRKSCYTCTIALDMLAFTVSSFLCILALWRHPCCSDISTLPQHVWNTQRVVPPVSMVGNTSAPPLVVTLPLYVTMLVSFVRTTFIPDIKYQSVQKVYPRFWKCRLPEFLILAT
jgi:hypothetical protein